MALSRRFRNTSRNCSWSPWSASPCGSDGAKRQLLRNQLLLDKKLDLRQQVGEQRTAFSWYGSGLPIAMNSSTMVLRCRTSALRLAIKPS